jgi:glutathione peroxidase-family protein
MSESYPIPQFIIDYLQKSKSTKNPQNLASATLKKNKTPEIENWFKENEVTAGYLWKFFVFYGLNKFSFRKCLVCEKRINTGIISKRPNRKYCSNKCKANSKEVQEKFKQTCKEKYGVENPFQNKKIQEKIKQTCKEKYGVENPFQNKKIREKIKQTCKEKYGVEHPMQSKTVQEKHKQTCKEKYGVEYPFQSEEFKEKFKQTCKEKYGVEYPFQNKKIQEKIKQTCKEKYGVESPSRLENFKEKGFKTKRSNHWETFCSLLNEKDIIPMFSKEEYIDDTGRKFKCLVCGEKFESEGTCDYDKEHLNDDGTYKTLQVTNIYCPHCFKAPISKKEKEVLEFVKSIYEWEILENHKGLFPNKKMELDIFLPSLNLGIEFDGNYWHSLEDAKERDERKNQLCEERRIRLIRIKEEDWTNNRERVEKQIREVIEELIVLNRTTENVA